MTKNKAKSTTIDNRKQEVQLWEFAVDRPHIIWDWTTSIYLLVRAEAG